MRRQTIVITATFTAEPIQDSLDFWMQKLGIPYSIVFTPYNQVFQQLLDPTSLLTTNQQGINVVLVRFEDWARATDSTATASGQGYPPTTSYPQIEQMVHDLIDALRDAAARAAAPYIVCVCPASHGAVADANRLETLLTTALEGGSGVYVMSATELATTYPVATPYDAYTEALGHIPFTPLFYTALGTLLARKIAALQRAPYKVIVLDCDQTLWQGVCGEDGAAGIVLAPPHKALQAFMVAQHEAGMLLCLNSKNNEEDVLEVFARRPEMPLHLEHLVAWRLNWQPKSANLVALAEELDLGLESFIFLDDNPVECMEVQVNCPEVLVLQLPPCADDIPRFLQHVWALDHLRITVEDRKRTRLYQQQVQRERFRKEAPTLEAFLAGLELEVQIAPVKPQQLARVAQLTQRTNQFNSTTIRRSESDIQQLCQAINWQCLVLEVRDRFGDYGLVGVLIFEVADDAIRVDTLLLSCRVLGRGVEHRMLARLGEIAQEHGLASVNVSYTPTKKNQPALDFLESIGAAYRQPVAAGTLFRFPAEYAATLTYRPDQRVPVQGDDGTDDSSIATVTPRTADAQTPSTLMTEIATELSDVERILQAISAHKQRHRPSLETAFVAPRTPVEERVAEIWQQVLGVVQVGVHDNFFALGGDSLLITQALSRLRTTFGVDVSMQHFFETPTVSGIAMALMGHSALMEEADVQISFELEEETEVAGDAKWIEALPSLLGSQVVLSNRSVTTPAMQGEAPAPRINRAAAAASITAVGLVTYNRVTSLQRALVSYIDNSQQYDRRTEFVVADNSPDPTIREQYRQMLHTLQRRYGVPIAYAGAEEKRRFAKTVATQGDIPPDVVQFALFDVEQCRHPFGANRNALLLHTLGELVFVADDDTIGRVATAPDHNSGLALAAGWDPAAYWFFPDRRTALQAVTFVDTDILGLHEQLLGQDVHTLLASHAGKDGFNGEWVDPELGQRVASGHGRVAVTFNGLLGDCAWGAPFGYWGAPMGCLLLQGSSHARLVHSEAAYRAACTSREIFRIVSRPTLSDATFSMTTWAGLDNRVLLPPCMPVGRGQDVIFGLTVWHCLTDSCFGHLPWALLHVPEEHRRFWPGEIFRSAVGFDLDKLMIACIKACAFGPEVRTGKDRLRALGQYLEELGSLSLADFDTYLRLQAERTTSAYIALTEQHLQACGDAPAFWANDVRKYIEIVQQALTRPDYCMPLDLLNERSPEETRRLAQRLVHRFGQLLSWWPAIVDVAQDLRRQGQRLAQPV